ncbi:hypothetical protein Tco_0129339, partial [Tanacetum coccineum]
REELARDPSAFELFLRVHQNKKKMFVNDASKVTWNETAYRVGHSDRYARQQSIKEHNEDPFQDLDTVRLEQNLIKTELKIEKLHKKQIQKNDVKAQSSSSD